jgi:hypothetical protein
VELYLVTGRFLTRNAERVLYVPLYHDPPRNTRDNPLAGPFGSVIDPPE